MSRKRDPRRNSPQPFHVEQRHSRAVANRVFIPFVNEKGKLLDFGFHVDGSLGKSLHDTAEDQIEERIGLTQFVARL